MRISGVNVPDDKKIKIALSYVYGIGLFSAVKILREVNVDPEKKAKALTSDEVNKIQSILTKGYKIEGELRQIIRQNIFRLKDIKSYRGTRHAKRLPARGQRTKSNSRTVRGNVRKTAGSGKRKVELK
ncbi:30S ribosomal protein S13 [Candidatus Jorgensenbacteria bacterium RIFCSPLOWO2_02_FULL_45_12]|uniref:Small ribosomal subunit protein uS13 n=2 Tax=Candidatus Joergenseniibacteriota TaxID=1752739 RepID=A0A1F6BP41_9BACT|nr:MAG: 30S ribosomal protein S13 [Candidatus Jorgensenbacteria bacterium GW2011_GWA2_45_9]OGG38638.1 MAG: 30S ribosomal protein S13 [Candidatus Jorgensenbacteria bacterium RIFCSPHIGHO2_02_FULL_45_20]OGG42574.1 MAG: 30S ribosomal protein S13 [Candidatus Jorgensenbacteria bacterium RIFCSPLOWO2_02_FULL_45_12]